MVYDDVAAWQADLALLEFRNPKSLVTIEVLMFRIDRLRNKPGIDEVAVAAAGERLLAWCNSGEPVPKVEPPKPVQIKDGTGSAPAAKPEAGTARNRAGQGGRTAAKVENPAAEAKAKAKAAAMVKAAEEAYAAALAGQGKRHERRRGHWPGVKPKPQPEVEA